MKLLRAILLLSCSLFALHVEHSTAFVKLVMFGTRVDMKQNFRLFNVTHTFHNPKSLTNQSLDFDIILKRELSEIKLVVSYHVIALNNTIQNALVRRSIDVCFFLRNPRSDRLVKSIFDYVKQRSLLPPRCPIPASSYYMHNLRLADVPLPALLPESEFMTELAYYTGIKQEIAVSFRLYGKLVRIIENIMPIMQ